MMENLVQLDDEARQAWTLDSSQIPLSAIHRYHIRKLYGQQAPLLLE